MSGLDLKLIDAAQVPTPGDGRGFAFLGLDGRLRIKMQGGAVIESAAGQKGDAGLDGRDGINGINGTNGIDGRDGTDGLRGLQGLKGDAGLDGKNPLGSILGFNEFLNLNGPIAASNSVLIALKNFENLLTNGGIHCVALVDCSASASISFSLNCGGMIFTTGVLTFTGARRVSVDFRAALASSLANSFCWHSLQGAAVGAAIGASFNSINASGGLPTSGVVELRANLTAGQSRTRLAQIALMSAA